MKWGHMAQSQTDANNSHTRTGIARARFASVMETSSFLGAASGAAPSAPAFLSLGEGDGLGVDTAAARPLALKNTSKSYAHTRHRETCNTQTDNPISAEWQRATAEGGEGAQTSSSLTEPSAFRHHLSLSIHRSYTHTMARREKAQRLPK
jgi:hypothetical protein